MRTRLLTAILPALLLPAVTAAPAPRESKRFDWPQWRGPDRTDVSHETGLLKDWPADGPKLLWTYEEAGSGYSGPAIVGERYLTMGADDKQEYVLCLDARTGKRLWRTDYGARFKNGYGDGPRGTPTVDGELVYGIGGQGDLVCLKIGDGTRVWEKNLKRDLSGQMMSGWGYTESPLVDGDKVICSPGGAKGSLAALNKKTGDVLWRSKDLTEKATYSSPVVATIGGVRQYVQTVSAGGKESVGGVAGVAADDGRKLWEYERPGFRTAFIPTPVVHDDSVYITGGYGAGCDLIQIRADNGKFEAEKVYGENKDMQNHHGGVVLVGDYVYGRSDKGGWTCQEFKTGKVVWNENRKLEKGSLTCVDGMLYLYGEKSGTCVLIEASPTGWKEHGRFSIPRQTNIRSGSGGIWTHPVVANGRLYLRDQDLIFAYDVSAKGVAQ
jgi:outer membrane protein assembly factor BamB